jgi:A/G-specific adenine glycosylase
LWHRQFPQSLLTAPQKTPQQRKALAQEYVAGLDAGGIDMSQTRYVAALSPLVHVFTHLKLTMHAYQFMIDVDNIQGFEPTCKGPPARKWVDSASMDEETLSTGMRRCWELLLKRKSAHST